MHRDFFALDSKHPKYQKNIFLLTDKFPAHCGILISAMSTRNIFFKLYNAVKQTFIQRKGILKHRHPCEYPTEIFLGRKYECAVREINVTNAIYLQIEIDVIQNLKQSNSHRKIENSEIRDCC